MNFVSSLDKNPDPKSKTHKHLKPYHDAIYVVDMHCVQQEHFQFLHLDIEKHHWYHALWMRRKNKRTSQKIKTEKLKIHLEETASLKSRLLLNYLRNQSTNLRTNEASHKDPP